MIEFKDINVSIPEAITINGIDIDGITVKQYLPISDKLDLMTKILNNSVDDNNYFNPARLAIYYVIYMIDGYTNIAVDGEEAYAVYDKFVSSGLWDAIENVIPKVERDFIKNNCRETIENIYNYKNSALGTVQMFTQNYDKLKIDKQQLEESVADKDSLTYITNLLNKLD